MLLQSTLWYDALLKVMCYLILQFEKLAVDALQHFVGLVEPAWGISAYLVLEEVLLLHDSIELNLYLLCNTPQVLEVALHDVLEHCNRRGVSQQQAQLAAQRVHAHHS